MSKSEIFKSLQDTISSSIRVSMPGIVESYDFKTQKANVRVDIKELYGSDTELEYPILVNVALVFPGSGGASLTMPVKRGDSCLLIFLDRDITDWLLGASKKRPASKRIHHLSDAVAIPGLIPFTKGSLAKNNDDVLITYAGSNVRLKPNGIVDIHSAKELNIKTESVIINCKTANIKATDSATIETKLASVKATDNVIVETKTASVKATNNVNVECANAQVKASSVINTETPNFTQKGNMKIDGNIEVTGTSLLSGKLTSKNGIENTGANLVSNGKTFESHTHIYNEVLAVTSPQGPCTVSKGAVNSGQTQ